MSNYNFITQSFKPLNKNDIEEPDPKAKELFRAVSKRQISRGKLKVSEWNQANLLSSGFYHMVQGPNGAEWDLAI
jgi:hypothetical protein